MRSLLILLIIPMALASCSLDQLFVKAEKETLKSLGDEYQKYVIDRQAVPDWDAAEKKERQETLDRWKARIKKAEDQ